MTHASLFFFCLGRGRCCVTDGVENWENCLKVIESRKETGAGQVLADFSSEIFVFCLSKRLAREQVSWEDVCFFPPMMGRSS